VEQRRRRGGVARRCAALGLRRRMLGRTAGPPKWRGDATASTNLLLERQRAEPSGLPA